MDNISIELSESLREFVEDRVAEGGYDSVDEYVHDLIRADKVRATGRLEAEILKGIESGPPTPLTRQDWDELRSRIRSRHTDRERTT